MRVTSSQIKLASKLIQQHVFTTPILRWQEITRLQPRVGELYFKCENLQVGGAFSCRGSINAVLHVLGETPDVTEFVTHSSGNHGLALAVACSRVGRTAHIVLPNNVPDVKRRSIAAHGAVTTICDVRERSRTCAQIVRATGATPIHASENVHIIAGAGTVGLEFLWQVPQLDAIIVPVGGGSLASGVAVAAKHVKPSIRVFGAEPEGACDAYRSLAAGKLLPHSEGQPNTIADGLRARLSPTPFAIMQKHLDGILTVSEPQIAWAFRHVMEKGQTFIEPSAAVAVAAALYKPLPHAPDRVGVVLSGGNVDPDLIPSYLALTAQSP